MTDVAGLLALLATSLDDRGVPWAVVGGVAVSLRAEPRFTRDLDVAVAVADDRAAEVLVRALRGRGLVPFSVLEHGPSGRISTVRLHHHGGVVADVLFASSGIEDLVAAEATRLQVPGGPIIPVARTGHLIALKLHSVDDERLQDRLDLASLVKVATDEEIARARAAVRAIAARGFQRGRALDTALDDLLAGRRLPP